MLPESTLRSLLGTACCLLAATTTIAQESFVRGEVNQDTRVDLSDAVSVLEGLFLGGTLPECRKAADVNDDGTIDVSDPVFLLVFLFAGGDPIPPPHSDPGADPTPDALACPGAPPPGTLRITEARFENEDRRLDDRLVVKGRADAGATVQILDDESGELIGSVSAGGGEWEAQFRNLAVVPCVVRARNGLLMATRVVASAPSDCGPGDARPPTVSIEAPPSPLTRGEEIVFIGRAVDPEGLAMRARWHFGGAVDASVLETVESDVPFVARVVFDEEGQAFRVTLTVTDADGHHVSDRVSVLVGSPPASDRVAVGEAPYPRAPEDAAHVVLAFNDLGMHCQDLSSVPFSVLPPFNTLHAQVIERGREPRILGPDAIRLRYSAASARSDPVVWDADSEPPSINSTSANFPADAPANDVQIRKADFWDSIAPPAPGPTIVSMLFGGLNPPRDEGLPSINNLDGTGRRMPGFTAPYVANDPQPFSRFHEDMKWFTAEGIPITGVDDFGRLNSYPLLRVEALAPGGSTVLASVDAVAPVSSEVDCRDCHLRGGIGADPDANPGVEFVETSSPGDRLAQEIAAKTNVIRLHDARHDTRLREEPTTLCASCHNSFALEEATGGALAGDARRKSFSASLHGYHGALKIDPESGALLRATDGSPDLTPALAPGERPLLPIDPRDPTLPMEANCFTCHPGKITQCFRGAMFGAGMKCSNCHGSFAALAGETPGDHAHDGQPHARLPWRDEPRCESCHVGDARSPAGGETPRTLAFDPADPAAVALRATNPRFREEPGKLYRNSRGHGGIACAGCHGPPHAIWPAPDPIANDNVAATQLQGHIGTLRECTVCHTQGSFGDGTLEGPHGMHPVNDPRWIREHESFAERRGGVDRCAPCHGTDHRGTRLSRVPVDRELREPSGRVQARLKAGEIVSCDLCHSLSTSFED